MSNINNVRKDFGCAIKAFRKHIKKNQTRFAEIINDKLNSKAFTLDQKKISQLENGKKIKLSKNFIEEFISIFKEMCNQNEYSIDETILDNFLTEAQNYASTPSSKPIINIFEHENLLVEPHQDVFIQYSGKYNCFFYSTDSTEKKYLTGIMEITNEERTKQCKALFSLIENEKVIKKYEGVFFINRHYNMWYCILIGTQKQEVCMIASQLFTATLRKNLFNVALVITTSAGVKKRPTMHRMIISREDIPNEKIEVLLSQLKLNDDTILISESKLKALKKDITQKLNIQHNEKLEEYYRVIFKCIEEIEKQPSEKYYRIDESLIYDSSTICTDKKSLGYAISIIRQYTNDKYYNKLSDTVHEICSMLAKKE